MIGKTIEYTDYNGVERKETFMFHLSEVELTELELGSNGGYAKQLQDLIDAKDILKIIDTFKTIILKSFGVKSDDGKRFIKSDKLSEEFSQTEAYVKLYMELATDAKASAAFINGIMPAKLREEVNNKATKEFLNNN